MQLIKLLAKNKLVKHQSKPYDGYRLTAKGYDYLALKSLAKRGTLQSLGIQVPALPTRACRVSARRVTLHPSPADGAQSQPSHTS